MTEHRWINPHQPQTLYMAVILCYVQAFFLLLQLGFVTYLGLFIIVGLGVGGYGIANEKKWGYSLAVAAAIVQVLLYFVFGGVSALNNFSVLIGFMFDAALVALLLHPLSRDYQRIWFR